MEVTITHLRRHLFELVSSALDGQELWVTHKGRRLRLAPEPTGASRLSRVTSLAIVTGDQAPADDQPSLQDEMRRAWEADWTTL